MNSFSLRLLLVGFAVISVVPLRAQTETWNDSAGDQSWSDTANWTGSMGASSLLVPGVQPYGTVTTNTVGYNVIIGTLGPGPGGSSLTNPIIIDTNSSPSTVNQALVSIGNLTFDDTTGVAIGDTGTEFLTITGATGITNTTTASQVLLTQVNAGANDTYAGGPAGGSLTFSGSLNIGTFNIATSGTVNVSGNLMFTINSTAPGQANTTFGAIGPINATGAIIQIDPGSTYVTNATLAADAGDFFKLSTDTSKTPFAGEAGINVPTFTDTGLTWITTLIQKGILFVEPTAGGNIINAGVTLPIDNDNEFNTGSITFNGGELATDNNGDLVGGTAFSTSRLIGINTTGGTIAATTATTGTYNGIISNGNGSTGPLTIGDSTNQGTVVFTNANTYGGGTTVAFGTLETANTAGSATGSGAVGINSGATLFGISGSSISGTVTAHGGGHISLQDGTVGTLTVGGLSSGQAGTPSSISFDIQTVTGTTTVDKIVDTGSLSFVGANGTTIAITNLGGTLVAGTYDLISYTGTQLANLNNVTLSTTSLGGETLSLVNGTDVLQLQITTPISTIGTTYNLTTTAAATRVMSGHSTNLTTTITNTGTGLADTLNYTGLKATGSGVAGSTTSGGPLANGGGSGSNTGQTFSSTTAGAHTITPGITSATNATIGGSATLGTSTGTTVDVLNNRTEAATAVSLGRVLVGQTTSSQTTTITSATGQDASLTRITLGAGSQTATGVSNGTVTLASGASYQFGGANDGTNSTSRGVTGSFTTAGNQSGTALVTPTGEGLAGESVNTIGIAYTADAVNKRVITNGATTNLGTLHTGATVTGTSTAFTSLTSHTLATDVTVAGAPASGSPDANGVTLTGSSTLLNGTTTAGTRTFGGTITGSGATTGSFNLAVVTAENGGAGLTGEGTYSDVTVAYTANVYSGQSVWAGTGTGGSWGTLAGTGANAFGLNWGANQGSPGLDPNFTSTDSATFNNVGGQATQLVSLNGASPSLNSITFNAAATSYTLAKGTSGTISLNGGIGSATVTDTAGTHTISAPVSLTTSANVDVASGQKLTFSGAITGSGGLTMTGTGTTVLSGTDSYLGTTAVNAGTLAVNGTTLATGIVTVANGATLTGTGTTGLVTVSGGGNINLQDGAIGTLTVKSLVVGNAITPSVLSFDIGSGSSGNLDKIVDNGTLTLSGLAGTTIDIGNVSGTPTLTNGIYTLISYTGTPLANLNDVTLSTLTLDGKSLSLSLVGDSIDLTVSNLSNSYTLAATAANSRIMVNTGTTTITSTITNTGSPGTLSYTGLDLSSTGGTLSGGTLPKDGGPLAASGGSDSGTRILAAGSTTGAVTITPVVGGVTNTSGTPVLASTTPATVDIVANRVVDAGSVAFGRVMTNLAVSQTSTLTTTGDDADFTRVTVGTASADANGISATGGTNPTFNSASVTDTRTVGGTFTTAGSVSGTLTLTTTGEGLAGETPNNVSLTYTADPVNKRVITNGATTNLGTLHSGATVSATSNAFTTSGTHDTTTDVTVAAGSGTINGITLSGGPTVFNGTTSSDTRTFGGTISSSSGGTTTGTFNLAVTGEGLVGEGTYANVAVAYTAFVYTGQGVWNTNGNGSWGTVSATPANWTANGGAPGLDVNFTSSDTATFGNVLTSGTGTVTLDGDNPSLKGITFNNTLGASYVIAQGSGGTLTLNNGAGTATIADTAGNNTISAPILLNSNGAASVARSTDTLTLSGGIGQGVTASFTVSGPGTVVLSGVSNVSGGTFLTSGTLNVTGSGTLGSTGNALTISGGTLDLGTTGQLAGAVAITGASTIQNGTLTGASYAVSAPSGTTTVNASLAGAAALTKTGAGAMALNGANSYSGGTTISAGTIAVGNLSALGTGDVTFSGGTLETGNGVHQINVGGTYTQTGGTLVLNLTGTTAGADPGYEFLNVGGGTGTANLGGALRVNVGSPYVPMVGDAFTFVQAGTINGGFTSISTNLFSLSITQQGAGVIISQLPFATLPGITYTPNQEAVAQYIDTSFQNGAASKPFQTLMGALNTAAGSSGAALPATFSQLTPEKFGNFARTTPVNNAVFSTQLLDGYFEGQRSPDGDFRAGNGQIDSSGLTVIGPDMDPGLAQVGSQLLAWSPAPLAHGLLSDSADPVTAGINMEERPTVAPETGHDFNVFILGNVVMAQGFSQEDVAHSNATTGAVQIGVDYKITPHLRVGAIFGYGHTDADLDNIGSKATVDSYSPGAYLSYAQDGWYFNALGSYGFNSFTQDRMVSFGGLTGDARSAPSGDQIVGNLDGGYDFHVKKWTFGPTAGVQYTHLDVDSFTEEGADPVDLQVGKQETDSLRSRVGGHVSYVFQTGKVLLTPHLDASWQHEFMDQSRGITSQFTSVGAGSFLINTANPSRDSALIDTGLTADLNGQVSLYLDYLVQAGQSNYFGQSVQAGAKVGF